MKMIPLSKGMFAKVDDADYEWLSQWKWKAFCGTTGIWYAIREKKVKGKRYRIRMHRDIMNPPAEMEVDHKNHDGLDNRRSNLRVCTTSQNQFNTGRKKNNKSGYKGVYFHRMAKRYVSVIRIKGVQVVLGYFKDPVEAAKTYDAAARKHHGEFAWTNFRD